MKTKDKKELSTKTIKELKMLLKEKKNELFSLIQEHAQKKLKNTRSIFWKKKEIAVISTILREKELFEDAENI